MAEKATRITLGNNLAALMKRHEALSSAQAIETATERAGLKVGRSTVDRVKKAGTPVNLDALEVLAAVFHRQPWQLLHPALGDLSADQDSFSLNQAVDLLAAHLERFPEGQRNVIGERLLTLAKAPDSGKTKQALLTSLQEAPAGEFLLGGDSASQRAA